MTLFCSTPVALLRSEDYVPYLKAERVMKARAVAIAAGEAGEQIWLLEHPPLYTAGTSANSDDLRNPQFPVFKTGRGGQYTYHGPGQRVAYAMLDLRTRGRDVSAYVRGLEECIILTLLAFGVKGERRCGRVGVWVVMPDGSEKKIAAIGVRLKKWVSFHGISINVDPDLSHFGGIVPCGLPEFGVTSLKDLGVAASMNEVDTALIAAFQTVFGPLDTQE